MKLTSIPSSMILAIFLDYSTLSLNRAHAFTFLTQQQLCKWRFSPKSLTPLPSFIQVVLMMFLLRSMVSGSGTWVAVSQWKSIIHNSGPLREGKQKFCSTQKLHHQTCSCKSLLVLFTLKSTKRFGSDLFLLLLQISMAWLWNGQEAFTRTFPKAFLNGDPIWSTLMPIFTEPFLSMRGIPSA